MQIDPAELSQRELYQHMARLITPRPIAWVSTQANDGVSNLAPFSYFNAIGSNPPTLMFCPANRPDGTPKDTLANIQQNGEFVVNLVSFEMAERMNQTSAAYDAGVSEFDACGLTATASGRVKPPRVQEAKVSFECVLHTVMNLGTGPGGANLVIGRILIIHVADDILDAEGRADPALLDAAGRLGGISYCRTTDRFDLDRPAPPK
jgi:flavin reductase (DIM6/NTAB) family NADH-FMN oxidoreductase RutF